MPGTLGAKFNAVLSSQNARECVNTIHDFTGSVTADDIEDLKTGHVKSQLGSVIFNSGFFNVNGLILTRNADENSLEWIRNASQVEILLWIHQSLAQYLVDRFGGDSVRKQKNRALEYLELLDSLNRELGSFFTMHQPLIAKSLEPAREGVIMLKKDLTAAVGQAGTAGTPEKTSCAGNLFKDMSRRLGLERIYMTMAYQAIRFDYSDNCLVSLAKKAAAIPPSLQKRFWGTSIINPALTADYESLIRSTREIGELIRGENFNLAGEKITGIDGDILKTALGLLNDGNDVTSIVKILMIRKETLLSRISLLHDVCLKGVMGIIEGVSPGTIMEMQPPSPGPMEFPSRDETIKNYIYFSEIVRREGFLALEDDVFTDTPSISAETSPTTPKRLNDFITKGLKLVINGIDPELVLKIMRDEADRRLGYLGTLHAMMIEGALSIQCGDNPRIVEEILKSYADNGAGVDTAFERISHLSAKARKKGLFALQEDIETGERDFLSFLLTLAVNHVSPDIIRETAREASARIIEEAEVYCDFRIKVIQNVTTGAVPSEKDLSAGIPFYGSDLPELFTSEQKRLEPVLKNMRSVMLASGKTRIPAGLAFPLLLIKEEGLWNTYFSFRESLREKCSLLAIYQGLIGEDAPVPDMAATVTGAIEGNSEREFALISILPSISEWAKKIERDVPKNVAVFEKALAGLIDSIQRIESSLAEESGAGDAPINIETLISNLSPDDRSWLRERLTPAITSANDTIRTALTALIKKHGIQYPSIDTPGAFGSFEHTVRACVSAFDFSIRMRLMRELEKRYGKNSASPAGACILFEDILMLEDRHIITILRYVDTQELAKALKYSDGTVCERVYSVMSENAAKLLREDIELMGNFGSEFSRRMKMKIAGVIWKLYSEGELELPDGGDSNPAGYNAIRDYVYDLIPIASGELNRSIRRKHNEITVLIGEIEQRYGLKINKTIDDWGRTPWWEVTPPDAGYALNSESKAILGEITPGEADDYTRALMPEDIIQCLDYTYPISDFNELWRVSDSSMSKLFALASIESFRTALKGIPDGVLGKILKILPHQLREIMKDEIAQINPSPEEIKLAQKGIMEMAYNMAGYGELSLAGE